MNIKELANKNLKIHYVWTFCSSFLFLSPIITLYYLFYGLNISDILLLSAVFQILNTILEIPTSTFGDTFPRSFVLKISSIFSLFSFIVIFLFPNFLGFIFSIFFSAFGQALWSGTGQAKLQEDLEKGGKKDNFGSIIAKLITLQNLGTLITPIGIFFILKYFENGFRVLAFLDIFVYIVAIFFVFQFKEYNLIKRKKFLKEEILLQKRVFLRSCSYFKQSKELLFLLIVMIFVSNISYLGKIIFPSIVQNGVENFVSSYLVWFSILFGIIGNLSISFIIKYISWEKTLLNSILLSSIIYFLAYIFVENNFILSVLFVLLSFVLGIFIPVRNHFLMKYTSIREKATVRSLFLMIIGLSQAIFFYFSSFLSVEKANLLVFVLVFIGLIFGMFGFSK